MHDLRERERTVITENEVADSCVCLKVRCAARAVTRAYDAALRPTGLRATQLSVLIAIATEGAVSIAALAEHMGMDRSTLTRNLQPLANEGLVSLGAEGWRRSRTIAITRQGLERMRKALPYWQEAQKSLRAKLGAAGWSEVVRGLDRLGGL
jgi:DNA-binding MarR family transcriptional regulator